MKWIIQFVLKQFAQQSAKKTGIAKLLKENDPIVQMGVKKIEQTLKNIGVNPRNLTSTDDVLKSLNYHKAMMDQKLKQEFKEIGLGQGIKSLEKKSTTKKLPEWTEGWTPKVVEGGGTSADDFLKLKEDTYRRLMMNTENDVKAFGKRIIDHKQDVKFEKLNKGQRKEIMTLVEDRIKLGNSKFMDKHSDLDVGFDPEDFASGGIARVGMFGGGALKNIWKEFIEKLFIKTSNDIRLGKGKWAGLTQEQWIKQHDDLTKMLKKWEQGGKKGLPEGAEQYLGMNNLQITKAIKEAEKKVKKPKMSEFEFEAKKAAEGKPVVPLGGIDERTALKQKYPGISDDLLDKILVDANPQRKAEVMATMDEYLKLREIGKSEPEAYDIITKSFDKKIPTKHAEGGVAGQLHMNEGGRIGLKEGSVRDRLQKDYESYTKGADWMRTVPPKWWLFPEYDPLGSRDDAMTWFKERFMYGDLDARPTPLEAFKKSPELVKFKKWLKERKEKAQGGIAGQLHMNEGGRTGAGGGGLLLKILKGSGKKTFYRGEPWTKNEEILEWFDKLVKNTVTPKAFRGRWFTDRKDIADLYANPESGINLIKKVKLTPKEIEFGKKLIKRSKQGIEIGDNVVIPKHKVKDIETDILATIISNLKKPFAKKAEGGLAKVLGV